MPKAKENNFPALNIEKAVELITKFEADLKGTAQNGEAFAKCLGYKSANNGAFIYATTDLRKYGLLERRGFIASELAKKIAYAKGEQKNSFIFEAIINVPVFANLVQKIGKNYETANFQALLLDSGFSQVEALQKESTIKNLYKKIATYIPDGQTNFNFNKEDVNYSEGDKVNQNSTFEAFQPSNTISKDNSEIKTLISEGISLKIAKTEDAIDHVRYFLNRLEKEIKEEKKNKNQSITPEN